MLDLISHRIDDPKRSDPLPQDWIPITLEAIFKNGSAAEEAEKKVKEVIKSIVLYDPETNWPSEDKWKRILPPWFINSFRFLTLEELKDFLDKGGEMSDPGWHYGSWLDALENRVWEWWNSKVDGKKIVFTLIVDGWPYSIEAFEYLVKVAGAFEVKDKE